jgi:hypothetical protein
VGAFADDVGAICKGDPASVQRVFTQYERLSKKSGLVLNAEKTEILLLHTNQTRIFRIRYMGKVMDIKPIKEVKICGVWYCNNLDREYNLNIAEKISKMGSILKSWKNRNLTYEGKILITKTFGLSQLIYILQCYEINAESIKKMEQLIFGFLWLGSRSDKEKGVDRIKRSVLKNDYCGGGLNITDVECLNKSLKLKQFIRASKSKHPITQIQRYCLEKLGYVGNIRTEYDKITKREEVTKIAQLTINNLCDHMRTIITENGNEAGKDDKIVYTIANTDIRTYLIRKNKRMINCMYTPIRSRGVEKLFELCVEAETEQNENELIRIGNVLSVFPVSMIELAGAYDDNSNDDDLGLTHFLFGWGEWKDIYGITTKEIQVVLKSALKKTEKLDFEHRLGFGSYDPQQIVTFRQQCKNMKLRHIYYRLVSRDFYTKERMLRFRMSRDDECERCGHKETYRHLLWECREASIVWQAFNSYMIRIGQQPIQVNKYEDVFDIYPNKILSMIKVKVVQAMIQINRPQGWNMESVRKLALEIKSIELYNSVTKNKLDKTRRIWEFVK